jgi:hypothetical protein
MLTLPGSSDNWNLISSLPLFLKKSKIKAPRNTRGFLVMPVVLPGLDMDVVYRWFGIELRMQR